LLDRVQTGHREQQRRDDPEEDGEADDAVAQRARMRRQFVWGLVAGRFLAGYFGGDYSGLCV
jgi:hypothetical protein